MSDTITHRYLVSVIVPAQSGDGWSKYPDYSAEEIGRALRRALHESFDKQYDTVVELADAKDLK
jgi:hypothetical protein